MLRRSFISFMVIVAICILAPGNGYSRQPGEVLKGFFYDSPVQGLSYETRSLSGAIGFSGVTNEGGEFKYGDGETVTFSVGGLVLGSARGSELVTPADLVTGVSGDIKNIKNRIVTNMARFLQSLDEDGNVENGITITAGTATTVLKYKGKINFNKSEAAFTADPNVVALFAELGATLRTGAQARNHLRRTMLGIKKMTDVKIPMRDGAYLLADIFLPIAGGKYPAIMNLGGYGKAFQRGCICSNTDLLTKEEMEDRYFEGNPDQYSYENHEAVNSADWVPEGYVAIRVDARGMCNTPGVLHPYSPQETVDFYDAIEWAAQQKWSNGKIGLWGASYYAVNQYLVAGLHPPSLKAMIPVCADIDQYRDILFHGGLYNEQYRENWFKTSILPNRCLGQEYVDILDIFHHYVFDDPAVYGTFEDHPFGQMSADVGKVFQPLWQTMPLEHTGHIHVRGSSEAYINAATEPKLKRFAVVTGDFISGWAYKKEALGDHMAFFDYWLKGERNEAIEGVMHEPPVKMMVRTGSGGYFWQVEDEWPIDQTKYTKYYLDATPSNWVGDGKRSDFMKLSKTAPTNEMSRTYSAEVNVGVDPCWASGVSFVTDPLPEDILIAGYIKVGMWVSSTSSDMDIFASVRVIDENNQEVSYKLSPGVPTYYPVGLGWLKVSHRKLDPEKSTIYRPYHTHLQADYAPLSSGQVVPVEVEIWPTTALIKKGYRIRLDVQPADGCDQGNRSLYDATYHTGASNTTYTGSSHQSYLQLPIIPPK